MIEPKTAASGARRGAGAISIARVVALTVMWGPWGAAAMAQEGRLAHDVSQPIEFSADRLEIEEKGNTATFDGRVEAVQGDLRLTADRVKVFFKSSDAPAEARSDRRSSVSRIDAMGHVVLASGDETARGDWGIYDVDRRIITLGGKVVLIRGDTVIEGNRLELDLDLGRSKIETVPAVGEQQRVRGTFRPSNPNE